MKNKWTKIMAFAFALVFVLSLGTFNAAPVMAASEISEEAESLQDNLLSMLDEYGTKADIDEFLDELISQYEQYYGEGAGDEIKEMYNFLYDWVDLKKEIGEYVEVTDFSYTDDEELGEISLATMEIKCENGDAVLTYTITDDSVNVTIEEKETFGALMKKAALNTLLGMGTVFCVLIFLTFLISCFKYIPNGDNKKKQEAVAAPVVTAPVVEEVEEDVTDDLELVAVISAAIAAAEGTGTDGFRVRSIKRVRRSNW